MKSFLTQKPQSSVELKIQVTAKEMADFFNQALSRARENFSLEGFRKGHVPENLVIQHFGRQAIEAQSMDIAIEESYLKALKEHKLNPVNHPKIEIRKSKVTSGKEDQADIALEYVANVDVLPEFEIRDYKDIRIKKDFKVLEVTDSEIEKVFDHLRRQRAKLSPIDRPLKKGDWAEIEFEGSFEGVKRDDLSSKNFPLIIGEAQMVSGFETKLEGMRKGEEKEFSIIFPKDYPQDFLKNKNVGFRVKVLEIKERILPEVDEKFVKGLGHNKKEELTAAIKESIKQEKETVEKNRQENELISELIKRTKIDIPESLIEQETERMFNDSKKRLANISFDWQKYLDQIKKTEDELKAELKPQAIKSVQIGLILGKIAIEEKVDIHDKEGARKVVERLMEYSSSN